MKNKTTLARQKIKRFKDEIPLIVFLGDPGSGKGTQSNILRNKFNFYHISPGDLFREEMKKNSRMGRIIKKNYTHGIPQPNDLVNRLVYERLKKIFRASRPRGLILDMFPFNSGQAEALDGFQKEFHLKDPIILWLDIKDSEIIDRLSDRFVCSKCKTNFGKDELKNTKTCPKCGHKLLKRADDTSEIIQKRVTWYKEVKQDLKNFYGKDLWFEINGSPAPEIVAKDIERIIKPFIK